MDTANVSPVSPADDVRTVLVNAVSWGGVLAGAAAALVTQLVLNLIGVGVGASTLNPTTGDNPTANGFSIGAGIWWALSGIIAAFVGGYIASRLSGRPKASTGAWHGLISWALTTLVVFYLLTTAVGGLIGGAFNTVSGAVGGVGRAIGTAAQTAVPALSQGTDPVGALQQALSTPVANDPAAAMKDATASLAKALVTGDEAQLAGAREKVAQAMAKQQNIPLDQARARVSSYEAQARDKAAQAKQQAAEAAGVAARSVSRGALLGSLALILGAVASWFGGHAGTVDPPSPRSSSAPPSAAGTPRPSDAKPGRSGRGAVSRARAGPTDAGRAGSKVLQRLGHPHADALSRADPRRLLQVRPPPPLRAHDMARASIVILALAVAFGPTSALAGAADVSPSLRARAQAVCRDDALRLCGAAVPDEAAIVACMRPKRALLTPSRRRGLNQVVRSVRR